MSDTVLLQLASGNGLPVVHDGCQPGWWTRLAVRWDLDGRLHRKRQLTVTTLVAAAAALAVIVGADLATADNHMALAVSLFGVGFLILALVQLVAARQFSRLYGPATPQMIAALRALIAPSLWQTVSDAAARQRRVAPDLPVTPALIYVWLAQAIDAERGQTAAQVIVAAQAQAFG